MQSHVAGWPHPDPAEDTRPITVLALHLWQQQALGQAQAGRNLSREQAPWEVLQYQPL